MSGTGDQPTTPAASPTPATPVPIVAIVGPTASGKSELALELALRLGGEVVSADASQLYRGMDIGTAKLSPDQRRGIPHHQLDVLDVTQEASVAAYQVHARRDLAAIRGRGRTPVLVGGSGLYVRAVLDRLEIPPTDAAVRTRLDVELRANGVEALYARLRQVDPVAAEAIELRNGRRIIRALEVVELTGRPFSATMPTREHLEPTVTIGLSVPREELDERIAARVHRMWRDGLLEEVRTLDEHGLRAGRTASRALGYQQALAYLDGRSTREQSMLETIQATRRFARRQLSWFRPDHRVVWLPYDAPDLADQAMALVAQAVRDNGDDD